MIYVILHAKVSTIVLGCLFPIVVATRHNPRLNLSCKPRPSGVCDKTQELNETFFSCLSSHVSRKQQQLNEKSSLIKNFNCTQ